MLAAILAFNSHNCIHKVVDALLQHPCHIIIIDNGSEPPIHDNRVMIYRLEKGVGIIHGRNLGFTLRQNDEGVLALADDVIVPPGDWIDILEKNQDVILALRPKDDVAFLSHREYDDLEKFPDYIPGAPTSFQCVHFPAKVLNRIGFIDERYLWGDDGYMMRKNPYGVLRNYNIIVEQIDRGRKYWPLRKFYEELWRPGKINEEQWTPFPVRATLDDYNREYNKACPTIWTMKREEWPAYYDMSLIIKQCFEKIWEEPNVNRIELLQLCVK
jgi:hypothetical protein